MMLAAHCRGNPALTPLVLLHGFMGSADDWQPLLPFLQKYFYLVAMDLPGHGSSPMLPESGDGFGDFAVCLNQTLKALELTSVVLLGYSLGGRLAMAYARYYPQNVVRLLLEGAHPGLRSETERQQRASADQQWVERFAREPVANVLRDWYQQPVFADLNEAQRQQLIKLRQHQSGPGLARAMMMFSLSRQPDYRLMLNHRRFSAYYFYGEHDSKFGALGQSLLEQQCLDGLRQIDRSGHNIHRERPKGFASAILDVCNLRLITGYV